MKSIIVLAIALVPVTAFAEKVFKKADNETWDCAKDAVVRIVQDKGKRITVSGKKNVLSIASVGKLTVGGKLNLVNVEEVDSIAMSGTHNQVTWTKAKKGDKPKIAKGSKTNKIDQKK